MGHESKQSGLSSIMSRDVMIVTFLGSCVATYAAFWLAANASQEAREQCLALDYQEALAMWQNYSTSGLSSVAGAIGTGVGYLVQGASYLGSSLDSLTGWGLGDTASAFNDQNKVLLCENLGGLVYMGTFKGYSFYTGTESPFLNGAAFWTAGGIVTAASYKTIKGVVNTATYYARSCLGFFAGSKERGRTAENANDQTNLLTQA